MHIRHGSGRNTLAWLPRSSTVVERVKLLLESDIGVVKGCMLLGTCRASASAQSPGRHYARARPASRVQVLRPPRCQPLQALPPDIGDIRTLDRLNLCHSPGLGGLSPRAVMTLESLPEFLFHQRGLRRQFDSYFRGWLAEIWTEGTERGPAATERLALGAFFRQDRRGWMAGFPSG